MLCSCGKVFRRRGRARSEASHQIEAGYRLGAQAHQQQKAPVVVEAAGTASALATAVDLAEKGGVVAIPSTYWDPTELPGMSMGMKEVSLVPSITYGNTQGERDFELAVKILASTPELPAAIITHRYLSMRHQTHLILPDHAILAQ